MTIKESPINKTLKRAKFFQTVQVWPLMEDLNFSGWLSNFKSANDKELAYLILDFFMYFPSKMVDQMLISSITKAGSYLAEKHPDWTHNNFLTKCIYSFIPGENPNPTDSGHIFTRKLRDVLEIPENLIVDYNNIPQILEKQEHPITVILVDDFVGSGAQCFNAWNMLENKYNGLTLKQIHLSQGHEFVYAPLIVNSSGYETINNHCESLICTPCHILGPEYNLFSPSCYCWQGSKELFEAGTEMILRKSREIGIPSTGGRSTQDEKGFGKQGLAMKFEHGAPDAIPSFFYWCHDNWIPLFKKNYKR